MFVYKSCHSQGIFFVGLDTPHFDLKYYLVFILQVNTPQHEATQAVQTLADNTTNQNTDITQAFSNQIGTINLDMGSENAVNGSQMAALPVNQSGQIILTNDGQIGGKVKF